MQAVVARRGWIAIGVLLVVELLFAWNADAILKVISSEPPFAGPQASWLVGLVLVLLGVLLAGKAVNGRWSGAFIDSRNRYSISQAQAVLWLIVISSGIMAAAIANVHRGNASPLDLSIPPELLAIIGLSVTTLVGTPVVRDIKRGTQPDPDQKDRTLQNLGRTDASTNGTVVSFIDAEQTGWADLVRGEETGNADKVDLGKLQLLYVSAVVLFVYGAALYANLGSGQGIGFPPIDASFVGLLGLSHAGALAFLAAPHADVQQPGQTGGTS